jgi:hypothetical protein
MDIEDYEEEKDFILIYKRVNETKL